MGPVRGHTETVALLLDRKAEINAADQVRISLLKHDRDRIGDIRGPDLHLFTVLLLSTRPFLFFYVSLSCSVFPHVPYHSFFSRSLALPALSRASRVCFKAAYPGAAEQGLLSKRAAPLGR